MGEERTCPHITDSISKDEDTGDYRFYHGVLCCPKCLKKINAMSGSPSSGPVSNLEDIPDGFHIIETGYAQ